MGTNQTYIAGKHHYSFRPREKALVTGVRTIQPTGQHKARVCYEILYDDGVIDSVPVSEVETGNYVFCKKEENLTI